jgi:hypothetical protein
MLFINTLQSKIVNIFIYVKEEYTVSILDSKWKEVKRNINILFIPRKNEYIYLDEQYYE